MIFELATVDENNRFQRTEAGFCVEMQSGVGPFAASL
jgi:hypothetical protein